MWMIPVITAIVGAIIATTLSYIYNKNLEMIKLKNELSKRAIENDLSVLSISYEQKREYLDAMNSKMRALRNKYLEIKIEHSAEAWKIMEGTRLNTTSYSEAALKVSSMIQVLDELRDDCYHTPAYFDNLYVEGIKNHKIISKTMSEAVNGIMSLIAQTIRDAGVIRGKFAIDEYPSDEEFRSWQSDYYDVLTNFPKSYFEFIVITQKNIIEEKSFLTQEIYKYKIKKY